MQTLKRRGQKQVEEDALEADLREIVEEFRTEVQTLQLRGCVCLEQYRAGTLATMALFLVVAARLVAGVLCF